MHSAEAIVAPATQVAVRRVKWAVMARATDVENPTTALGHAALTHTAPDSFVIQTTTPS